MQPLEDDAEILDYDPPHVLSAEDLSGLLRRRSEAYRRNPADVIPMDEVFRRIEQLLDDE